MPTLKHVFTVTALFCCLGAPVHAERIKLGDVPVEPKKTTKDGLITEEGLEPETDKPLEDNVAEEFYQKGLKALDSGELDQAEAFFDRALVIKPNHKGAQEGIAYIMQTLDEPKVSTAAVAPDPKAKLMDKLQKNLDEEIAKGNWEEAHAIASKILAIDANHVGAKSKLTRIKSKLHDAAVERAQEREAKEDYSGAIDAYRSAQSYRNDPLIPEKITALRKRIKEQKLKKSEALYVEALQKSQEGKTDEAIQLCKQVLALNPEHPQAQRMLDRLQPRPQ